MLNRFQGSIEPGKCVDDDDIGGGDNDDDYDDDNYSVAYNINSVKL